MNYSVLTIPPFDKQLNRLSKKYPSLKAEFANLITSLEIEPEQGTLIGFKCFKIRISILFKGKGKRGGARVITNVVVADGIVYLLNIYDKSEKDNLTDKELEELLKWVDE